MMKPNAGLANKGIERILELSADAHIRRRRTVKGSPEFHNMGKRSRFSQHCNSLKNSME